MKNDYLERGDIEERDHFLLEKMNKRMTDEHYNSRKRMKKTLQNLSHVRIVMIQRSIH